MKNIYEKYYGLEWVDFKLVTQLNSDVSRWWCLGSHCIFPSHCDNTDWVLELNMNGSLIDDVVYEKSVLFRSE